MKFFHVFYLETIPRQMSQNSICPGYFSGSWSQSRGRIMQYGTFSWRMCHPEYFLISFKVCKVVLPKISWCSRDDNVVKYCLMQISHSMISKKYFKYCIDFVEFWYFNYFVKIYIFTISYL